MKVSRYAGRWRRDPRYVGVSISVSSPVWFRGNVLSEFAPTPEMLGAYRRGKMGDDEYIERYMARLSRADWEQALAVAREIEAGARAEAVFLCWCAIEGFSWCHRTLFAEEASKRWGVEVVEL